MTTKQVITQEGEIATVWFKEYLYCHEGCQFLNADDERAYCRLCRELLDNSSELSMKPIRHWKCRENVKRVEGLWLRGLFWGALIVGLLCWLAS